MLSDKITEALNAQIIREADAESSYLAMASWCEKQRLTGCAAFFYKQSAEEREHLLKIFKYINDNGGMATVPGCKAPQTQFQSIEEAFTQGLDHEQSVTKAIYDLVDLSNSERDYATLNFLQWYVTEQQEEELLFTSILDRIALIGLENRGLWMIDKAVKKLLVGE